MKSFQKFIITKKTITFIFLVLFTQPFTKSIALQPHADIYSAHSHSLNYSDQDENSLCAHRQPLFCKKLLITKIEDIGEGEGEGKGKGKEEGKDYEPKTKITFTKISSLKENPEDKGITFTTKYPFDPEDDRLLVQGEEVFLFFREQRFLQELLYKDSSTIETGFEVRLEPKSFDASHSYPDHEDVDHPRSCTAPCSDSEDDDENPMSIGGSYAILISPKRTSQNIRTIFYAQGDTCLCFHIVQENSPSNHVTLTHCYKHTFENNIDTLTVSPSGNKFAITSEKVAWVFSVSSENSYLDCLHNTSKCIRPYNNKSSDKTFMAAVQGETIDYDGEKWTAMSGITFLPNDEDYFVSQHRNLGLCAVWHIDSSNNLIEHSATIYGNVDPTIKSKAYFTPDEKFFINYDKKHVYLVPSSEIKRKVQNRIVTINTTPLEMAKKRECCHVSYDSHTTHIITFIKNKVGQESTPVLSKINPSGRLSMVTHHRIENIMDLLDLSHQKREEGQEPLLVCQEPQPVETEQATDEERDMNPTNSTGQTNEEDNQLTDPPEYPSISFSNLPSPGSVTENSESEQHLIWKPYIFTNDGIVLKEE